MRDRMSTLRPLTPYCHESGRPGEVLAGTEAYQGGAEPGVTLQEMEVASFGSPGLGSDDGGDGVLLFTGPAREVGDQVEDHGEVGEGGFLGGVEAREGEAQFARDALFR